MTRPNYPHVERSGLNASVSLAASPAERTTDVNPTTLTENVPCVGRQGTRPSQTDVQSEAEEARRYLYIHGYLNETESRNCIRRIRGYKRVVSR